jgi:serine/threonine-protein kinase
MTDRRHRIAELLRERYDLEKLLGEGGFAAVYRVRNLRLGRTEALKVLSQHMTEESEFAKRFEQEAKVSASLDHPNIVKIYDYGVTEEIAWFSMQLVQGESLAAELGARPIGMEPTDVAEMAVSILDALEYSHARGVIHRDIKPDNILVDAARRPYLTDFGIAKAEDSLVKTRTGMLIGSPAYMAPEQMAGGAPDGRTDVYALGITLYRMLTLQFPFTGEDTLRMAMKKLSGAPEPLLEKRPNLPPDLARAVMTAIEREPSKRFATAEEMRQAFEEYLLAHPSPNRRSRGSRSAARIESMPSVTQNETVGSAAPSGSVDPTLRVNEVPPTILETGDRRSSRRWVPAAIGVALLGALGAWWGFGRPAAEKPVALASNAPPEVTAAPALPTAPPTAAPTRPPEPPPPAAAAAVVPTERPAAVSPREMRRREPTPRVVVAQSSVASPSAGFSTASSPAASVPAAPPARFCGTAEPTAYHQATAQEMPSGFSADDEGEVGRAPRADSARIQIEITVRPAQPQEGETFEVTARLVNGGDSDVEVSKIEESAVRASGGFQPVGGVSLPTTVSVGGAANVYKYTGVLRGGATYFKEIRVTDSLGDSWKTSLRLLPCPGG